MEQHKATALYCAIISDRVSYDARVRAARHVSEAIRARDFVGIATNKAHELRAVFQDNYSAEEILFAAQQVAQYMAEHIDETDKLRENAFLKGRAVKYRDSRYVIVPSDNPAHAQTDFRVVNTETGAESSLYPFHQCGEIISLALKGELKWSFDL